MKKFVAYLSVTVSLLFGALALENTTTAKADSVEGYDFAVTRPAKATDMQGDVKANLPVGSAWRINSESQSGNMTLLELAPNTFASLYDGYVYLPIVNDVQTIGKNPTPLYDHNGQLITDRELAPETDWYVDRVINLDHKEYFRVATDEFVSVLDVAGYQNY